MGADTELIQETNELLRQMLEMLRGLNPDKVGRPSETKPGAKAKETK